MISQAGAVEPLVQLLQSGAAEVPGHPRGAGNSSGEERRTEGAFCTSK